MPYFGANISFIKIEFKILKWIFSNCSSLRSYIFCYFPRLWNNFNSYLWCRTNCMQNRQRRSVEVFCISIIRWSGLHGPCQGGPEWDPPLGDTIPRIHCFSFKRLLLLFLFICHNHDYLDSKFTLSEPFSTITLQLEIFTEKIIPSASCRFKQTLFTGLRKLKRTTLRTYRNMMMGEWCTTNGLMVQMVWDRCEVWLTLWNVVFGYI